MSRVIAAGACPSIRCTALTFAPALTASEAAVSVVVLACDVDETTGLEQDGEPRHFLRNGADLSLDVLVLLDEVGVTGGGLHVHDEAKPFEFALEGPWAIG